MSIKFPKIEVIEGVAPEIHRELIAENTRLRQEVAMNRREISELRKQLAAINKKEAQVKRKENRISAFFDDAHAPENVFKEKNGFKFV